MVRLTLGADRETQQVQFETLSCAAPYGGGGLGRHFAQLIEDARARRVLACYFAANIPTNEPSGRALKVFWLPWLMRFTPVRFSHAWKILLNNASFDYAVSRRLTRGDIFRGFDGMARLSFLQARRLGYKRLELEAAMSHIRNVCRQIELAHLAWPIEPVPIHRVQVQRTLAEYELADAIWVNSEYARQTFLAEGIPAARLKRRCLTIPARFQKGLPVVNDGVFRVVYTGGLSVAKGIPVLLEAFHRLQGATELTLVGGSGTRGMRRYLEGWTRRDPRIKIAPGDPLPHLQRADVYVHPSYQDGFGYAPMEALACGVPVIVTEDTGMKEHVVEGVNGYVVPTGNWEAMLDRLEQIRKDRPSFEFHAHPVL